MAFARRCPGGTELEISMLFVDVRGSTQLAERMTPTEFGRLMNRFYHTATDILIETDAVIDKLVGDEVIGFYLPIFTGPDHARPAVVAAQRLLRASAEHDGEGSRLRIGVGVHTGNAYVGTVSGAEGTVTDITALGDNVNVAARLASLAGPEEALISEEAIAASGFDLGTLEERRLELKGKSRPITAHVLRADGPIDRNHETEGGIVSRANEEGITTHTTEGGSMSHPAAGAIAGLVSGLVYGAAIQGVAMPMPMGEPQPMMEMVAQVLRSDDVLVGWLLLLATSIVAGTLFGTALGDRAARLGPGLAWGALFGLLLYLVGGLILMPVALGMSAFAPIATDAMRATSLLNLGIYLVSGVVLGAVFAGLSRGKRAGWPSPVDSLPNP